MVHCYKTCKRTQKKPCYKNKIRILNFIHFSKDITYEDWDTIRARNKEWANQEYAKNMRPKICSANNVGPCTATCYFVTSWCRGATRSQFIFKNYAVLVNSCSFPLNNGCIQFYRLIDSLMLCISSLLFLLLNIITVSFFSCYINVRFCDLPTLPFRNTRIILCMYEWI